MCEIIYKRTLSDLEIPINDLSIYFFQNVYFFVLRFSCKNGQKFVTKPDFQAGVANNLVTNLFATCQVEKI